MAFRFDSSGNLTTPTAAELAQADADSYAIVLNRDVLPDGTSFWVYAAIKPSKYQQYLWECAMQHPIILNDYGNILKCGFGEDVPADVKVEMKTQYGIDENFMAKLKADVLKAHEMFLRSKEEQRIGDIVAMLKKKNPQPS